MDEMGKSQCLREGDGNRKFQRKQESKSWTFLKARNLRQQKPISQSPFHVYLIKRCLGTQEPGGLHLLLSWGLGK